MRIYTSILKACASFLLITLFSFESKAGEFKTSMFMQSIPGNIVHVGALKTTAFFPMSGNFIDFKIKDFLSLSVPLDQYNYTQPFSLTATVKVTPYNAAGQVQNVDIETVILSINYNPYTGVSSFNDAESKLFTWHHPKFDFQLMGLQLALNGGAFASVNDLPLYVRIDGIIKSNRIANFIFLNPGFTFNGQPHNVNVNCDNLVNDEIEVNWTPQAQAKPMIWSGRM